jgi:hypothetical protein
LRPRGSGLSLSRAGARRRGPFIPGQVPQISAGYFWDPAFATGGDAAGFTLPEGNGKTTHNVITPAAGTAPAIGTINGQAVITYTNQAVADDMSRTAAVQRGFTGAMGFGGWLNQAAAAGTLFVHGRGATQDLYLQFAAGSVRVGVHDGVSAKESQFPIPPGGYAAGPFFIFATFDPALAATSRIGLTIDTVAQAPNVAGSPGTAARDSSDVIALGGSISDSSTSNIGGDWSHGVLYLTRDVPSSATLLSMFNHKRLK